MRIKEQIKFLPLILKLHVSFSPKQEIRSSVKRQIIKETKERHLPALLLKFYANLFSVCVLETQKWLAQHPEISAQQVSKLIYQTCYQGLNSILDSN